MNYKENPRALYELSEREMKDLISATSIMAGTGPVGRTEIPELLGMFYSTPIAGRRGKAGLISLYLVAKHGLINVLREALGKTTKGENNVES